MIVVAVDPGSRFTAIVSRDLSAPPVRSLLTWTLLDRSTDRRSLAEWVLLCAQTAREVRELVSDRGVRAPVAVEDTNAPQYHGRAGSPTNPTNTIETAAVMGGIIAATGAIIVPQGGYGAPVANRAVLLAAYPAVLVGSRETTGGGKSPMQHVRAAFDLARAAGMILRAQQTSLDL